MRFRIIFMATTDEQEQFYDRKSRTKRLKTGGVCFGLLLILSSCASAPPRLLSEKDLLNNHRDFLRSYQSDIDAISKKSEKRIAYEYQRARLSKGKIPQSYDMLVLSGGGAFGSFGAGFLKGWGKVRDAKNARPQFDSISGISTGSLIAPFAFIGTPEAYDNIINLYENPGSDWVRDQGILSYLPDNASIYDTSKLHDKINSVITPAMIKDLKKGHKEGRQVLIGATNLDYGSLRVWDLARIASEKPVEKAIKQTVSILSASTAIPGLFSPITIDNMLYVDGGATVQVVTGMEGRSWAYNKEKLKMKFVDSKNPIKIRIWIIVNQKLVSDPKLTPFKWPSIASRSLNNLIRTSTLQSIQDMETYTKLIDQRPEFDAQIRYVAIPQDFPIANTDEMFDAKTMRALVKLGKKMGADPSSWRTEALRPGAPF
jgi:hypothetical protein